MGKFKVGDRVTLQKSSQHYGCGFSNPKDTLGIVIKSDESSDDGYIYRVEWGSSSQTNCYTESDLEFFDTKSSAEFKLDDMVIMKREPTEDEWSDIGEISIPKVLYEMSHKIAEFNDRKDGIRLHTGESDGWYPVCCFELPPSSSSKKDKLIVEARKRYPKGTYFLSAKSGDRIEACELYSYDTKEDMLTDDGWAVYSKGKWAVVDGRVSTRFDIGDKVIGNGLADDEGYDVTNAGWIGYVYKINGEEIKVGYTSDEKESSDAFWVKACCFDIYQPTTFIRRRRFNVGDMVIANSKTKGRYAITVEGWTGEVKEIKPNGMIAVYGNGLTSRSDVDEACFDLYKEGSHISSSIKTSENGKAKHDDSERVIKVSHNDFQISRGDQIRGSRINGSASEISVGNRHRNYEERSIRS